MWFWYSIWNRSIKIKFAFKIFIFIEFYIEIYLRRLFIEFIRNKWKTFLKPILILLELLWNLWRHLRSLLIELIYYCFWNIHNQWKTFLKQILILLELFRILLWLWYIDKRLYIIVVLIMLSIKVWSCIINLKLIIFF